MSTRTRTNTEDKLWAALHANPNSTAADLSATAGIGKSTAGKILARWAGEGTVTRTAGIADGGHRAADLWTITPTDTGTPAKVNTTPVDVEQDAVTDDGDVDTGDPVDNPTVDTPEPTDTAPGDSADDPAPDPDADAEPVATKPDADAAEDVPDAAVPELAAPTDVEPDAEAVEPTAADTVSAATGDDGGEGAKAARLGPGALRGMVEDHLRDNPGAEFSPVEIARVLGGKSTGAVSNALDKLVETKIAVQTKDRPRRYALAPDATETTPAASA